jgi:hypothetical protein
MMDTIARLVTFSCVLALMTACTTAVDVTSALQRSDAPVQPTIIPVPTLPTALMPTDTPLSPPPPPLSTPLPSPVQLTRAARAGRSDCPVTQPPKPAFIPPAPWPSQPPGTDEFWFGNNDLWTALPLNGSWRQLALGEKFWWWSEEFDVSEDTTPNLTVKARRLDGDAPAFLVSEATNGYHESFNWAMLTGAKLASPGCWEFTGHYKGHQLSFILWVPPE